MSIKIDDDVPLPVSRGGGAAGNSHALRTLKIGQSFVYVPRGNTSLDTQRNSVWHMAHLICPDRQFLVRIVEEDGKRVVRIWRVESPTSIAPAIRAVQQ